jgi:hypothetical protein
MIRILNLAFIAVTAIACLGLYRIAEEARIADAELNAVESAIAAERNALVVLGAEWARVTEPTRIQALAAMHLPLSEEPTLQLSSLTALPERALIPVDEPTIRSASIVVPAPAPAREAVEPEITHVSYSGT